MLQPVEKPGYRPPMKVGFGTKEQRASLLVAGAEQVYAPDDLPFLVKYPGLAIRDGDTVIFAQPGLMKKSDMTSILSAAEGGGIAFQVIGHEPVICDSDAKLSEFRRQKPRTLDVPVVQTHGRPATIQYTDKQADAIIREWHAVPKRPPREVVKTAEGILGLETGTLKTSWVRDLVIKYVGTAQRAKPDHWAGISTEPH
ncbi:hypothetical protein [Roseovarius indicus]|uniref:Uncharacterized protein n=2 Tax=Roseovarius indicus TaxID=540747 RepID=A0A5P3AHT5_9RHOB|nr:hypothetical protein [Roseovarius indicus]QEW27815.1 hypothetical protein RIdsm_03635 [Roseovarius indicus]SFE80009.1 hypothetical protein SAMN04488031_12253 [Roseovarius indicus]